jgi:hypothetical protein
VGARPARHSHVYSRDLRRDPASVDPAEPETPHGVRLGPVDRGPAGLPALSLAVTDGNPAMHLYDALGFERVLTSFSVDLDAGALRP